MKECVKCPNCGNKEFVTYSMTLLVVLLILGLIPGIIYLIVIYKKCKCKVCGCQMHGRPNSGL